MSHRISRFLLLTVAAVAACGPFHQGRTPDSVVIFNNQSLDQADVYAARGGGGEVRIGTVFSNRREALRLPSAVSSSGDFTVIARIFASNRRPRTGPLQLAIGDTIEVTLPPDGRSLTVLPPRSP
jgi:hypothetical protein